MPAAIILSAIIAAIVFFISGQKQISLKKEYYRKVDAYKRGPFQRYLEECKKAKVLQEKYQSELEEYHIAMANDNMRLIQEEIRKAALEVEVNQLQAQNAESKKTLEKIYASNVIFPKYRNMVMVCSLYEYICSGRCDTLDGHEGAYNILEMEIRLDRVVTQLDQVIDALERIQHNQYIIYTAIQDANRQLQQFQHSTNQAIATFQSMQEAHYRDVREGLQEMRDNNAALQVQFAEMQKTSALTAYQSERIQKELAYMNRMDYLTGRNDGVFFNRPPV